MRAAPCRAAPSSRGQLRLAAFVVILGFMVLGPCYRQVLGGGNRVFRSWQMFADVAVGVVDSTFLRRRPNATDEVLDRFTVLGYAVPREAPAEVWRIVGRRGTWEVAQRLCSALGPGADVRAISRMATRAGWEPYYRGAENLCVAPSPRSKATDSEEGRR